MKDTLQSTDARIGIVDIVRGFAALSVCWFHFTQGNETFLEGHWLKPFGKYGWLGVEIFFVVSGFIIPFSMDRGGYQICALPTFVAKRIIRLDPPYLASIALVLFLHWLAISVPGFAGRAPEVSALQMFLHLGYLNAFFGYDWLLPIYWTLAIEFQYYLLIALIFPILTQPRMSIRVICILALCGVSLVCYPGPFVFTYLGLFALGLLTFQVRTNRLSTRTYLVLLVALVGMTWWVHGTAIAMIGSATALIIAYVNVQPPSWLALIGTVSYSLYLLHVPIGGRVINLGARVAKSTSEKLVVLAVAFVCSLIAAYLFYRLIEKPSQVWSARLKYRKVPQRTISSSEITNSGSMHRKK